MKMHSKIDRFQSLFHHDYNHEIIKFIYNHINVNYNYNHTLSKSISSFHISEQKGLHNKIVKRKKTIIKQSSYYDIV